MKCIFGNVTSLGMIMHHNICGSVNEQQQYTTCTHHGRNGHNMYTTCTSYLFSKVLAKFVANTFTFNLIQYFSNSTTFFIEWGAANVTSIRYWFNKIHVSWFEIPIYASALFSLINIVLPIVLG